MESLPELESFRTESPPHFTVQESPWKLVKMRSCAPVLDMLDQRVWGRSQGSECLTAPRDSGQRVQDPLCKAVFKCVQS